MNLSKLSHVTATDSMAMMQEQELFYDFQKIKGTLKADFDFKGLTQDSRQVLPGFIFVAIKGHQVDGHQHLEAAIQKGASALVVEELQSVPVSYSGAVYHSANTRLSVEVLAKRFYRNPSAKLKMIGVTGTNGKTSVTYMLEHLLNCQNLPCAVIGTINHHFLDQVWDSQLTTPDPISLQKRLAEFLERGAQFVAMEVSSHALDQRRVESVQFDGAVFTNLSRDHLDYHQTMENYFQAKARLFSEILIGSEKKSKVAVLNYSDQWVKQLAVPKSLKSFCFDKVENSEINYKITGRSFGQTSFRLKIYDREVHFELPMPGEHNVQNMVSAILVLVGFGIEPEKLRTAVSTFSGVPGRLQKVPSQSARAVFVDYAHSPDALENVLKTLLSIRQDLKTKNKVKVLFGCGGDRDRGKRPLMAQVAATHADEVIVTSDNPRTEPPQLIIDEILKGLQNSSKPVTVEVDRKVAIELALDNLKDGDVLLIAGKGHEDYQIIGTKKIPFSDFIIAREWLKARGL